MILHKGGWGKNVNPEESRYISLISGYLLSLAIIPGRPAGGVDCAAGRADDRLPLRRDLRVGRVRALPFGRRRRSTRRKGVFRLTHLRLLNTDRLIDECITN